MKRGLAVMVSVLLLMTAAPLVSAENIYNDGQFDWGEYSCPHTETEEVEEIPSTCVEQGCTGYTRCAVCKVLVAGSKEPLPLGDHTYDSDHDADCNHCGAIREVEASLPGDANGDGKVNNRDLGILQQYLNEWDVTVDVNAADLNGDGRVNNRDLGLLQQLLNG